jgi:hypothetical protein
MERCKYHAEMTVLSAGRFAVRGWAMPRNAPALGRGGAYRNATPAAKLRNWAA